MSVLLLPRLLLFSGVKTLLIKLLTPFPELRAAGVTVAELEGGVVIVLMGAEVVVAFTGL